MTTQTEHTFVARINAKGMQGNSAKIEFDWKLPGSKFPFTLYERDPDNVAGWTVGDSPHVTITRGSLKEGKDGQYASDYFWNLVSLQEPGMDENAHQDAKPAQRPTATATRAPEGFPDVGQDYQRPDHPSKRNSIERQTAINDALARLPTLASALEHWDDVVALADRILEYIQKPPRPQIPEHTCMTHMTPFRLWYDATDGDAYAHIYRDEAGKRQICYEVSK